jgi:hypothetical protein
MWTSYSIANALESIWKSVVSHLQQKYDSIRLSGTFPNQNRSLSRQIPPHIIEITAALERALEMCFTGDPHSITVDLMGPLGLKKSLIEHGIPTFISSFKFDLDIRTYFTSHPADWSLNHNREPAVASKHVQLLTYGEQHYLVHDS